MSLSSTACITDGMESHVDLAVYTSGKAHLLHHETKMTPKKSQDCSESALLGRQTFETAGENPESCVLKKKHFIVLLSSH